MVKLVFFFNFFLTTLKLYRYTKVNTQVQLFFGKSKPYDSGYSDVNL